MGSRTVTQRSFLRGEARPEFLEADDLEIRAASLRTGRNIRIEAPRTFGPKLGSRYMAEFAGALDVVEIRPDSANIFLLCYGADFLKVLSVDGLAAWSAPSVPWPTTISAADVWIEPYRERIIIGGFWGLYELVFDTMSWTFQAITWDTAPGNEVAQAYWSFNPGTTLTPSALTGSVNLTCSDAIFSASWVGLRLRYNRRSVLITGFTSPTVLVGTVDGDLPPSYRLTVGSVTGFKVGDIVVGDTTGFEAIISAVGVGTLEVATLTFFDGPDTGEKISSANNTTTVSGKAGISPVASEIWDEQLISDQRGYPRAGQSAGGRLFLCDFPEVPDLVACSSSRSITDFKVGADDDDAIAQQVGDNVPRFRHAVNAGDLLLLSDKGIYYVEVSAARPITPSNFVPLLFDSRAANAVRPAKIDDGVVFVEGSGTAVAVARLEGNIYKKWKVNTISTLYAHLIVTPTRLCGPSDYGEAPEKYLFVVNSDGTMAAMSWFADFDPDSVAFVLWETEGSYLSMISAFGSYLAICERTFKNAAGADETTRTLEAMDANAFLDCEVGVADAARFRLMKVACYDGDNDCGDVTPAVDGTIAGAVPATAKVGFNFTSRAMFWPVEMVEAPYHGMKRTRVVRGSVSVQDTVSFKVRCNNTTKTYGGYRFGDDLSEPPPRRTFVAKFSVVGVRDHPEIEFIRDRPGPFRVLAQTQEVTY
jgi:hypothetical protein